MKNSIIAATILYQSRMIFRRKTYWIIQGLLVLIIYINVFQMMGKNDSEADFVATIVGKGLCMYLILAAGFLVVPAVLKNSERIAELLWVTPLKAFEFTFGLFGGIYIPMVFVIIEAFMLHYLGTLIPAATAKTPSIGLLFAGILPVLVVVALAIVFYLAISMISRSPLVVYAVAGVFWVAWLSGLIEPNVTMLSPLNVGMMSFTLSKSAGMGLDRSLLIALYSLWVAVAATILVTLPWLIRWNLHLDYPRVRISSLVFMAIGVFVCGVLWMNFEKAVKTAQVPQSPQGWQTSTWKVMERDTRLNLEEQNLSGETSLVLLNSGTAALDHLLLALNAGLEVISVTDGKETLSSKRDGDAIRIDLQQPVIPGQSIEITMVYQGQILIPREDYAPGTILRGSLVRQSVPVRAYLGNNTGYLERDGDWEPWSYSDLHHQAEKNNYLSIVFSHQDRCVISSGAAVNAIAQDSLKYTWKGDIPPALLAYGMHETKLADPTEIIICQATNPDSNDLREVNEYIELVREFYQWFGEDTPSPIRAAQLPYRSELAWGNGALFYPEPSGVMTGLRTSFGGNPTTGQVSLYRAYQFSLTWWQASLRWPSPKLAQFTNISPQVPYGRLLPVSEDTFDEALAWFSAIHINADHQKEPSLIDREIAFWQKVQKLNQPAISKESIIERQSLYSDLAIHGIPLTWSPNRLYNLANEILMLDKIYHDSGEQPFKMLLHLVHDKYMPGQSETLSADAFFELYEHFIDQPEYHTVD